MEKGLFLELSPDELHECDGGFPPIIAAIGWICLGFASAAAFDGGRAS